jgi:hypothetical protein
MTRRGRSDLRLAMVARMSGFEPGLDAGVLETVGVAALVAELERIVRHFGHGDVEPGAAVEHRLEARHRSHAHVVVRRDRHRV